MTLNVRIVLFSTFNSKNIFMAFFGLTYSPLNSAPCRKISLGTLNCASTSALRRTSPAFLYFFPKKPTQWGEKFSKSALDGVQIM